MKSKVQPDPNEPHDPEAVFREQDNLNFEVGFKQFAAIAAMSEKVVNLDQSVKVRVAGRQSR